MMNVLKLHDEGLKPEFTFADVQGQPTEVMNPDAIIHLAKTGGTDECHALYRAYLRSHFERRFRDAIDRMLANPPDSNESHQIITIDLEREIQELLNWTLLKTYSNC